MYKAYPLSFRMAKDICDIQWDNPIGKPERNPVKYICYRLSEVLLTSNYFSISVWKQTLTWLSGTILSQNLKTLTQDKPLQDSNITSYQI